MPLSGDHRTIVGMNSEHLRLCSSAEWGKNVADVLFPWVLGERDLGADVLEVGPGPGLTTDLLRQRVDKLTAVEIDPTLAEAHNSLGFVVSTHDWDWELGERHYLQAINAIRATPRLITGTGPTGWRSAAAWRKLAPR